MRQIGEMAGMWRRLKGKMSVGYLQCLSRKGRRRLACADTYRGFRITTIMSCKVRILELDLGAGTDDLILFEIIKT